MDYPNRMFAVPTSWFAGMAPERRNLWMVVYITVFNALHSAIFSTIVNIAYETHIKRSIVKEENRIKSLTVIGIIYAVGSLVLQMVLPQSLTFSMDPRPGLC